MDGTTLAFALGTENRLTELIKAKLYDIPAFKALDVGSQTAIVILIAALMGIFLAFLFALNALGSIPTIPVPLGEVATGIALSMGSAGIQRLLDLAAAWTSVGVQKAQVAKAQAAAVTSTKVNLGSGAG